MSDMDTNNDGKLSKDEVQGPLAKDFSNLDTDNDGYLSESEIEDSPRPQRPDRRQ